MPLQANIIAFKAPTWSEQWCSFCTANLLSTHIILPTAALVAVELALDVTVLERVTEPDVVADELTVELAEEVTEDEIDVVRVSVADDDIEEVTDDVADEVAVDE